MQINSSQEKLLTRLSCQINDKLGIKIGYSHWMGAFTDPDDQFCIYVEGVGKFNENIMDYEGGSRYHLLHNLDYVRHGCEGKPQSFADCLVSFDIAEHALHDDECQDLLKKIYRCLEDGTLEIPNTIHEGNYKVTKHHDGRFSIEIDSGNFIHMFSCKKEDIAKSVHKHQAQEILDIIHSNFGEKC